LFVSIDGHDWLLDTGAQMTSGTGRLSISLSSDGYREFAENNQLGFDIKENLNNFLVRYLTATV